MLSVAIKAESQDYKFVYYLDKDLNSTSKGKATIIGKAYEHNGLLILNCFPKNSDKMSVAATVKDSTLSTLHGIFRSYHDNMQIESEGNYFENEMEGLWKYWNSEGYITDSAFYEKGVRIAYGSFRYYFKKPTLKQLFSSSGKNKILYLYDASFTDSLKDTFSEKEQTFVDGIARTEYEVFFAGNKGLLKQYDSLGVVTADSVFTRDSKEAEFKGGEKAG